jgi:xanthine dehydrogenase YagS FAD-binding subunit
MRPFRYLRADRIDSAIEAHAQPSTQLQFLAGGTTLLDLMKLGVMHPDALVDINPLRRTALGRIEMTPQGLRLGALVRMADLAAHAEIARAYPVLTQSLAQAASPQLRNMATLGGNVLQRTRCAYFRDTGFAHCNKRDPGSGCAAIDGINRLHAVLGTSRACIASYPGDFAQALMVLDASVTTLGPRGERTFKFATLHETGADDPQIETRLQPAELLTAFTIAAGPHARRSVYVKVRDRASYAFALASAAVALVLDGDRVRDVRIALGGVATRPWRATEAEKLLIGEVLDERSASRAAAAAFAAARTSPHNAFKVPLGQRVIVRALLDAQRLEG